MRTLSADWMANTNRPEGDLQNSQHGGEESRGNFFYPRPVAPTAAQVSFNLLYILALLLYLLTSLCGSSIQSSLVM